MELMSEATPRRPQGVVAKLLAQQPTRGNQTVERNDDDSDETPEQEQWNDSDDSSSNDGSVKILSVATPPSSPETLKRDDDELRPEDGSADESSEQDPRVSDAEEDIPTATDPTHTQQLESDVAVLVTHLQEQTLALEHERTWNQALEREMATTHATLAREIDGLRIENDALRHQNALLVAERDASVQRAATATESHDELLRMLKTQQQREDHARTIIAALVKERDGLKKQLDESKTYCRRLEDDVVTLRAEQQHLRAEAMSLKTAVSAVTTQRNDRERLVIQEQAQVIESLRADMLQMEFEYKTLSVDKERLSHRVATLERQSERHSTSYDVISLRTDDKKRDKKLPKRLSVSTASTNKTDSFTNLMTLPNCVDERTVATTTAVARPRTPMGSLMSKTLTSAKKKLFQSATPVVLPQ